MGQTRYQLGEEFLYGLERWGVFLAGGTVNVKGWEEESSMYWRNRKAIGVTASYERGWGK